MVTGPDFSITPRWRPRCQICPYNGKPVESPRPQNKQVEVPKLNDTKDTSRNLTKNKQDTLISQIWPSGIWPLRTLAM